MNIALPILLTALPLTTAVEGNVNELQPKRAEVSHQTSAAQETDLLRLQEAFFNFHRDKREKCYLVVAHSLKKSTHLTCTEETLTSDFEIGIEVLLLPLPQPSPTR